MDAERIKEKVCSYIRAAHESKDEPTMRRYVSMMNTLYIENCVTDDQKEAFFMEVRFRLDMITSSLQDVNPNRMRCLFLISRTAVAIKILYDREDLLNYLTKFCDSLCDSISSVVRQYVCLLAGVILKCSIRKQRDDQTVNETILSPKNYRRLFLVLKKRWLDKVSDVRKTAIRSISRIQDDPIDPTFEEAMVLSAKDMLLASLGDRDPSCRVAAIKALTMVDNVEIRHVISLAFRDNDLTVQRIAIHRLTTEMPYNTMSPKERVNFVENFISRPEPEIRELFCLLLLEWVSQAYYTEHQVDTRDPISMASGSFYILKAINFMDHEEIAEKMLFEIFQSILVDFNNMDGENGIMSFVTAFSEHNSPTLNRINFRKMLINGSRQEKSKFLRWSSQLCSYVVWYCFIVWVDRHYQSPHRCNAHGYSTRKKAALAFHWYNLIAFCCSCRFTENVRADCRFKLISEMRNYAEFVHEFVSTFHVEDLPREFAWKRFCITQLLKIFQFLDKDPDGMQAWRDLLFNIFANPNIELHPKLVEQIVLNLMEFHFPRPEDSEDALNEFSDILSLICSNANPTDPHKIDDVTRTRCLTIIDGILKTGRFTEISTIFQSFFEFYVEPCLSSNNVLDRSMAYAIVGIFSVFHEHFAKVRGTLLMKSALAYERKEIKLTCITTLCDMVLVYGYEKVAQWFGTEDQDELMSSDGSFNVNMQELHDLMLEVIDDADPQLSFVATETFVRWILAEKRPEWNETLTRLMFIYYRENTRKCKLLYSLLERFFLTFCSISRSNKLQLISVIIPCIKKMREKAHNDPSIEFVSDDDMIMSIVKWSMPNLRGAKEPSLHNNLAKIIVKELDKHDSDDRCEYVYCKMLSMLKFDRINETELGRLLKVCTELIPEISSLKNRRLFEQFHKKLMGIQIKMTL